MLHYYQPHESQGLPSNLRLASFFLSTKFLSRLIEEEILRTLFLPVMQDRVYKTPACLQRIAAGIQGRIAQHGIQQQTLVSIRQVSFESES